MFSRPMRFFSKRDWHRFMVCAAADGYCVVHYPTQGSWLDFDYYADFFLHPASAESLPERAAARRHLVSCAAFLHILKKAPFGGKIILPKGVFIYTISR